MKLRHLALSLRTLPLVLLAGVIGAGCAGPPTEGEAAAVQASAARHEDKKVNGCPPGQAKKLFPIMDSATIDVVPRQMATLDMRGPNGTPITLADAESQLCGGTDLGDQFGDGSDVTAFGANQEVWFDSEPTTGQLVFMIAWPGYTGTLQFHGEDPNDQYVVSMDGEMTKNGAPIEISWYDQSALDILTDELHRGLLATFSPDTPPPPPGTLCTTTNECFNVAFSNAGLLAFNDFGLGLWTGGGDSDVAPDSVVNRIDLYALQIP